MGSSQDGGGAAKSMRAERSGALRGEALAPGDKSISHRALMMAALATGESRITGLLEGDDVLRTAAALRAMGAEIECDSGVWRVLGGALASPRQALYFGNSGTGARLMMGLVAGAGLAARFEGDRSLRGRPMGRVLEPLRTMGLETGDADDYLPVEIKASAPLRAIECKLAKPSAQVKSAILLAALGADGKTVVHEPVPCRDHTERMLGAFGVPLTIRPDGGSGRFIEIEGGRELRPTTIAAPGDPSSAAFLVAAALMTPQSDILVKNVMTNPLRTGFFETVRDMGADITLENERDESGEKVADMRVRHSVLYGVEVPAERAPSMIDEYPILAMLAAVANGATTMRGLGELRVKESDRIASVEAGLVACGVEVKSGEDWLRVTGAEKIEGGARIAVNHDHRIAMSFLILGGVAEQPIEIDDADQIATSFPGFEYDMGKLGARLAVSGS